MHKADLWECPSNVRLRGVKQTSRRKGAISAVDPYRSRPAGNGASDRVHSGHPPLPDIGRSFGGSDALRVNTSVRGEVVNLAARLYQKNSSGVTYFTRKYFASELRSCLGARRNEVPMLRSLRI